MVLVEGVNTFLFLKRRFKQTNDDDHHQQNNDHPGDNTNDDMERLFAQLKPHLNEEQLKLVENFTVQNRVDDLITIFPDSIARNETESAAKLKIMQEREAKERDEIKRRDRCQSIPMPKELSDGITKYINDTSALHKNCSEKRNGKSVIHRRISYLYENGVYMWS